MTQFLVRSGVCALAALGLFAACASSSSADDKSMQMVPADDAYDSMGRHVPSTKTLYSMTRILAKQGKDAECEAVLTQLIADHPEFRPAYADLAELYMRHERVDSAIETLRAGVKVAPNDALLSNNLGMCYMLQGRNEDALASFTAAANGTPKDIRTRSNMAMALGMMGRYEEALSVYMQLMAPADAHFNLGVLAEARQDNERAAQEYETADTLRTGRARPAPKPAPPPSKPPSSPPKTESKPPTKN